MKEEIKKRIMESMNTEYTLTFIKKAHAGQKYGSMPYWKHPQEVAETGRRVFGSKFDNDAYTVALLHDVIEDTKYDREKLIDLGYSEAVLDAVQLLTKDRNLSYDDNIKKIISSGNKTAMMVKFADNYVNYTGDKSDWDPKKREKSQKKYWKSMQDLGSKLGVTRDKMPEVKE